MQILHRNKKKSLPCGQTLFTKVSLVITLRGCVRDRGRGYGRGCVSGHARACGRGHRSSHHRTSSACQPTYRRSSRRCTA
jgi:hypothetical protein